MEHVRNKLVQWIFSLRQPPHSPNLSYFFSLSLAFCVHFRSAFCNFVSAMPQQPLPSSTRREYFIIFYVAMREKSVHEWISNVKHRRCDSWHMCALAQFRHCSFARFAKICFVAASDTIAAHTRHLFVGVWTTRNRVKKNCQQFAPDNLFV